MKFLLGYSYVGSIENSGGLRALQKLVNVLTDYDHTVYVFGECFANSKTISINDVSEIYSDDLIVIYPEVVGENPFNCKHVVRWILYHTAHRGIELSWSDTDDYFYYSYYYETLRKEPKKMLAAYDFRLDEFWDFGYEREGYCHLNKKNNVDPYFAEKYNSEHLPPNWDQKIELFNRKKYFITYDDSTYYICVAALCGCIPIVLYQEKTPEYNEKTPHVKYGVAYGFEEIEYAKETLHLMRPNLEELERKSIETIKSFIEYWEEKLNK